VTSGCAPPVSGFRGGGCRQKKKPARKLMKCEAKKRAPLWSGGPDPLVLGFLWSLTKTSSTVQEQRLRKGRKWKRKGWSVPVNLKGETKGCPGMEGPLPPRGHSYPTWVLRRVHGQEGGWAGGAAVGTGLGPEKKRKGLPRTTDRCCDRPRGSRQPPGASGARVGGACKRVSCRR